MEEQGKEVKKPTLHWRSIFAHFWLFLREYKGVHVFIIIFLTLETALNAIVLPLIYKDILDTVAHRTPEAFAHLRMMLVFFAITLFSSLAVQRSEYYVGNRVQTSILKKLSDHVLFLLEKKSYTFYTNTFTGGLVAKMKRFVNAFGTLHDLVVWDFYSSIITLIASVGVLWYFSTTLGAVFFVWLMFHSMVVYYTVRLILPKRTEAAEADSQVTAQFSDIISNILTVKMFGVGKRECASFAKTTEEQRKKRFSAWVQSSVWNPLFLGISSRLFQIVLMTTIVFLWERNVATAGLFILIIVYVQRCAEIVYQMSRNITRAQEALIDAHEMVEILDKENDVRDKEHPEPFHVTKGEIVFEHVRHAYENGDSVFSDFNLTMRAGERVAFVGHSGAGKTTIVKLLLRFVDVESGAIRIDGQNIADVRQDDLRANIAYVPQEPLLFHRSLFENIAYGKQDASFEEVRAVAKRARADGFIEKLREGYDTPVGERGVKLSGGERQRVAIARALLKDAPIVVLDEATSALDSLAEHAIQEAFDELMRGRTTIVIAHRLSTIMHMDRIVVLDSGAVAEEGTHQVLLEKNGIYAELWRSQVGGFIAE